MSSSLVKSPLLGSTEPAMSTPAFKLKDSPNRGGVKFNLLKDFGFVPEEIVVQKVHGKNNMLIVSAILTKEKLAEEEKRLAKLKKPMGKASNKK